MLSASAFKPARRQTSARSRRPKASRWGQLVAAAAIFLVLLVPGLREPVTGWVGGFITSVAQGDEQKTEPKGEKKGKKESRRDGPRQNNGR